MGRWRVVTTKTLPCLVCLLWGGCSLLFEGNEPATDDANCATLAPLRDDFSGKQPSPKWQLILDAESGIAFEEGTFSYPGSMSRTTGTLTSYAEHDFRNGSFTVPVDSVSEKGRTYISIYFVVEGSNTRGASITHEDSELTFSLNGTDHRKISYDPSRDQIWQIREEQGTIYFETGPSEQDLQVWTQSSAYGDFDPSHARVRLGVFVDTEKEGLAAFGGVNLSTSPTNYCSTESLVEPFDGDSLGSIWRRQPASACSLEVAGGILGVERLSGTNWCVLGTNRGFNLAGSSVELRLAAPTNETQTGSVALGLDRGDSYLRVYASGSQVWTALREPGGMGPITTTAIDLEEVHLLRLRHDGENVIWEVESSAGVTLIERKPTPFDLDGLSVTIFARPGEAERTEFAGLNVE